jgi:hypothetical protein
MIVNVQKWQYHLILCFKIDLVYCWQAIKNITQYEILFM